LLQTAGGPAAGRTLVCVRYLNSKIADTVYEHRTFTEVPKGDRSFTERFPAAEKIAFTQAKAQYAAGAGAAGAGPAPAPVGAAAPPRAEPPAAPDAPTERRPTRFMGASQPKRLR